MATSDSTGSNFVLVHGVAMPNVSLHEVTVNNGVKNTSGFLPVTLS